MSKGQKYKKTTHNFIHENGLLILNEDLKEVSNFNKIENAILKKVENILVQLNNKKECFIKHANDPDKKETRGMWEYRKFDSSGVTTYGYAILPPRISFTYHFFSPHSATNYLGEIFKRQGQGLAFNALSMFIKHTEQAIRLANESEIINDSVVIELSKACHYLEDLCETHHVINKIGIGPLSFILQKPSIRKKLDNTIISNHSEFEKYVSKVRDKYKISSVNDFDKISTLHKGEKQFWNIFDYYGEFLNYNYLKNRRGNNAFLQLCHLYAVYFSDFASGVGSIYYDNLRNGMEVVNGNVTGDCDSRNAKNWERAVWSLSQNKNDWDKNIEQTLKLAQVSVAIFLFIFLLYLAEPSLFNFPLKD